MLSELCIQRKHLGWEWQSLCPHLVEFFLSTSDKPVYLLSSTTRTPVVLSAFLSITGCQNTIGCLRTSCGGQLRLILPWPVWLSWLGITPKSELSPVRFQVRAPAWPARSSPVGTCMRGNRLVFVSHSNVSLPLFFLSLTLSLKVNKIFKKIP